ncbi:hypothetical protein F0P96_03110 [Hymenobacter busanensis]|uniref:Uncharacterized protein n=1 Tax=Hymenobacter busanensis TaxID=2607656 RepID=A0A7L4ZUF8_9BACT|nr:hypothetical protein [Hymenobacter busanensis]KAA9339617.1 hypothetical protein F0P96_03110 [Hymenobacter busanensis]QHJ06627.1 hypothetical protein GUY19_04640 [Hymenobacter busanensis]
MSFFAPFGRFAPLLATTILAMGCDSQRNATEVADPISTASAVPARAVSFQKQLSRGDYSFAVQTLGTGSQRQLTLRAERLGRELAAATADIEGTVSDAVVTNLNNDDYPELLVFVTDAGSGSYGQLMGYEFLSRGRRNLTLPELDGPLAAGYLGHDSFRVDGRTIIRSFPIYRPDDPNSTPSGGTRTIEYVMPKKEGALLVANHKDTP